MTPRPTISKQKLARLPTKKILGNGECEREWRPTPVRDSLICPYDPRAAEGEHGGACSGDSGGPLTVRTRKRWAKMENGECSQLCKQSGSERGVKIVAFFPPLTRGLERGRMSYFKQTPQIPRMRAIIMLSFEITNMLL